MHDKEDSFIAIKLPKNLKVFKSSSKSNHNPYDQLYAWAVDEAYGCELVDLLIEEDLLSYLSKKYEISITDFILTEEDNEVFYTLSKNWLKKKGFAMSDNHIVGQMGWICLQSEPRIIEKDNRPEWIRPGYLYMKKLELIGK